MRFLNAIEKKFRSSLLKSMWSRARSFTAAIISVESKGQWFCCMIQQTHDEHKTNHHQPWWRPAWSNRSALNTSCCLSSWFIALAILVPVYRKGRKCVIQFEGAQLHTTNQTEEEQARQQAMGERQEAFWIGDILEQAGRDLGKRLTYSNTTRWLLNYVNFGRLGWGG